jgi:cell division protein FtsW
LRSILIVHRRAAGAGAASFRHHHHLLVGAALMYLGGVSWKWFAAAAALAVGAVFVYLKFFGYASDRITAWRDPLADTSDTAYQIMQSLYSIGSGGLTGLGLGMSRQKYLYLPEEHNDFIFSIVCEELGYVGAMVILVLFALLIIRGYWLAMHSSDRYSFLVCAGITTLLAIQVFSTWRGHEPHPLHRRVAAVLLVRRHGAAAAAV